MLNVYFWGESVYFWGNNVYFWGFLKIVGFWIIFCCGGVGGGGVFGLYGSGAPVGNFEII